MIQKFMAPSPVNRCRYSSTTTYVYVYVCPESSSSVSFSLKTNPQNINLILPRFHLIFVFTCLSSRIGWMTVISMMGYIVEERTRKELNSTTPRDWTLSYIRDLISFILSMSLL